MPSRRRFNPGFKRQVVEECGRIGGLSWSGVHIGSRVLGGAEGLTSL
jgi:hypothetical protein